MLSAAILHSRRKEWQNIGGNVVLLLLAACGSNNGGQGNPGGTTPSPSTGTVNCGTLHESHAGLNPPNRS